uniref:DPEP2 neighbor n=1 Tax=Microcebus murinus TaxID=30608 RepID=A0A8C5W0F3_MICMU
MSDRILYINSNLSSVPWEGCMAAPLPPACPPLHGYYHLLYRGCGEAQVGWHGETYCLVGGYRLFGDAPLATPAKAEAEKPAPRRAPKRHRAVKEGEKDLGCPSPKIRRVQHRARRLARKKVTG